MNPQSHPRRRQILLRREEKVPPFLFKVSIFHFLEALRTLARTDTSLSRCLMAVAFPDHIFVQFTR